MPVRGTAGADPDAQAAVTAHGGVLVHANDLEYGAAGTSTGKIVRWALCSGVPSLHAGVPLSNRAPAGPG